MSAPTPVSTSAVNRDNPWPGLASFTEDSRAFFFGREKETEELVRLIRRHTLTVLFGQSGLGKSSLLQAGAFPQLRDVDFLPLYLRLDHSALPIGDRRLPIAQPSPVPDSIGNRQSEIGNSTLADQVKSALTAAFASAGADAPAFRSDETLWEYFHRKDIDIWSAKNRLLTPVLAFDQFEEIFTLGRATDAQRERGRAFLVELADLVENRAPAALREKFDSGELDITRFNFEKPSCQVVLSLREDFLPDLEGLKNEMRSIMQSRMRVCRLNGTQALEIVTRPAPHLLAEGVAERVVEFVAGVRGGSVERLHEMEVEPALLSVICRELNERRRALGQAQITVDLVSGNRREILTDFYERSVADLPEGMRAFVEDHLLTKSGFRDNLALETALEFPGVTRPLIDTLVLRRLVRIEDRLGVQRVELTHDVLAEVIRAARDERQQRLALAAAARRARQHRVVIAGLGAAVVALLVGAFFGIRAQRRAERAARDEAAQSSRTDFVFASQLLDQGKVPEGLAYLVRAARSDPANHTVGPRLISALAHRSFAEPFGQPLVHPAGARSALYLNEGRHVLTSAADGNFRYWELESGRLLQTFNPGSITSSNEAVSPDQRRVATGAADGSVKVWEIETGRQSLGPLRHAQRVNQVTYSPDGRWLLSSSTDGILKIWDAASGELKATLPDIAVQSYFAVSPDSTRVVAVTNASHVWRIPDGAQVAAMQRPVSHPRSSNPIVDFSPDGKHVVEMSLWGVQLYDAQTGTPEGPLFTHGSELPHGARFSRDGEKLITFAPDGTVRIWSVVTGKLLAGPMEHGSDIRPVRFTADESHIVTRSGDGMVRIWDAQTGRLALEPIRAGGINSFALHPQRNELLTAGEDGVVRQWRITPGAVTPLEMVPDSNRIAIELGDFRTPVAWEIHPERLQKLDLLTGAPIGPPRVFPAPIASAELSADGLFLTVEMPAGDFELWDLRAAGIVRHSLGKFPPPVSRKFSPDSRHLALCSGSVLQVWDTPTGQMIFGPRKGLTVDHTRPFSTWFSPTGRYLAALTSNDAVVAIDLASRTLGEPLPFGGRVYGAAFSPDEKFLAGFSAGAARIWELKTGQRVGGLLPHRNILRGATFTRDGHRLLTWTRGETDIWDVAKGQLYVEPMVSGINIHPAIFSPDERQIATFAIAHSEVRIWDAASGTMVAEPLVGEGKTSGNNLIRFTADGRFIAVAKPGPSPRLLVWAVPPSLAGNPVPDWLLRLAASLAGGEIDRRARFQQRPIDPKAFAEIRRELDSLANDAPYVEWGRWFLADRATRPIAPGLKITVAEARKLAEKRAIP